MSARLHALLDELRRLKRDGVHAVAVSEEALEMLRVSAHGRREVGQRVVEVRAQMASPVQAAAVPVKTAEVAARYAGATGKAASAGFGQLLAAAEKSAPKRPAPAANAAEPAEGTSAGLPPPPVIKLPEGSKRERWEWLRDRVLNCPVCRAHTHGDYKVVFGVGNIDADIFFCGEAPGGEEEIQGEPFIGPAGKLLTKMITGMGLQREQVYIGNILNWRPEMEGRLTRTSVQQTGNRPPTEAEMRFGLPYLRAQVEVVQPKVIVALGSTAAEGLLGFGSFKSLGSIRGQWKEFNGTPLMVTYHPSYLLRYASSKSKRVVWEDLLQVMERVGLPISAKQQGYFL